MSASENQSRLGQAPDAKISFGPSDTNPSSTATPATTVGSATAAGHGDHPKDDADDSNATLSSSRIGPQREDLEGEQMATYGEDKVIQAQHDKRNAGWGEQKSLTEDIERMKDEQQRAKNETKR